MRNVILVIILMVGMAIPTSTGATSLFDKDGCNLFGADKAARIGDIVTIVISESTSANNKATTQTQKKLNTDGEISVQGFLEWIAGFPDTIQPIKNLNFTPNETFNGQGSVQSNGTFSTKIAATVTEVLPNGNLVIEGVRHITIGKDNQDLTIRGVVRPIDISVDNTIPSNMIADMDILYMGKGIIAERQHDGILSKVFNFFF
jgi:flagellar L-ring protein FlgH